MADQSQPRPIPQCCWDHLEAAKAGHVECLRRLQEAGRFLGLHDPTRESAGEARKTEAWDAALAACKAGHAQVLSWLFSGGWPHTCDAKVPWHLSDIAQPWEDGDWEELKISRVVYEEGWALPEFPLYRAAITNPDTSCLEALLDAGCRSEWLCAMAAVEGREGHLALAAARGAKCGADTMYHAASRGNLRLLRTAHHHATMQAGAASGRLPLDRCGKIAHACCFEAAAEKGHAECLAALLTWFDDDKLWRAASIGAARGGHVSLLRMLRRRGWEHELHAVYAAAEADQADSLSYLLGLRAVQRQLGSENDDDLVEAAARGGLTCLRVVLERGFEMSESALTTAIFDKPECLQFVLDHFDGPEIVEELLESDLMGIPLGCLQVLYDRGYVPRGSGRLWDILQYDVLPLGDLECLKMLVANSGPPPVKMLSTAFAASQGPAFVQYIHELGAPWDANTMSEASASVETMRYAHENGCPWGQAILSDFIGKVECLQYAHENGCAYDVPARSTVLPDFEVLQYAWKHMDRGWAREVVGNSIKPGSTSSGGVPRAAFVLDPVRGVVNSHYTHSSEIRLAVSKLDWRVPLYLVKEMRMGRDELGFLAQLADVRLARAAALAECFYVAGKYVRQLRGGPWGGVWSAMARCPTEIREKIASDAHLALPPL